MATSTQRRNYPEGVKRDRKVAPAKLPANAPEGMRAAWWRENVMRMSREKLAEALSAKGLNMSVGSIKRAEASPKVSQFYKLACAALVMPIDFEF